MIPLLTVKNYLGIAEADTTYDVPLQELIDRLGVQISGKLDWYFGEPRLATEILEGTGTSKLFLRQPPVVGQSMPITVQERTGIGDAWVTVDPDDYEITGRKLTHATLWPRFTQVRVTYYEGFETVPGDVQQLLLEMIQAGTISQPTGDITSEKIGDYSYTIDNSVDVESGKLWSGVFSRFQRGRI